MNYRILRLFLVTGFVLCVAHPVVAGSISPVPLDFRNCNGAVSRNADQKIEQALREAGSGIVDLQTGTEMMARVALAGGFLGGDAIYFERKRADAPDLLLVGRVEGSPDNRGDTVTSTYRITVRLLGTRTDGLLLNYTSAWIRADQFGAESARIADKIVSRLSTWKRGEDIDAQHVPKGSSVRIVPYVSFSGLSAMGSFSSVARTGLGVTAGAGLKRGAFAIDNLELRGSAGIYGFTPKEKNLKSLYIVPVTLGVGREFRFGATGVIPCVSVGYQFEYMNRVSQEFQNGCKRYAGRWYADPVLSLSADAALRMQSVSVGVIPFYSVFFEKTGAWQYSGVSLRAGIEL